MNVAKRRIRLMIGRLAETLVSFSPGTFASALRRIASRKLTSGVIEISHGLFNGILMNPPRWNSSDAVAIKYGQYELEVQEWIGQHLRYPRRNALVIGAGDGLYGLGLYGAGLCDRVVMFERDKLSREAILKNWKLNGFPRNALTLAGEYGVNLNNSGLNLSSLDDSFFVVDIEGGEFEVLDTSFLASFSKASGVVEIHGNDEAEICRLRARLEEYFHVVELRSGSRNPSSIPDLQSLSDDMRWSVMSEGRQFWGLWFCLEPRDNL